jgi:hypothetical protein
VINLYGIQLNITEHAIARTWIFPKDSLVEFEPKDEEWCRQLGIGHEESKPGAYQIGDTFLIHPKVFDQLALEMKLRLEESTNAIINCVADEPDAVNRPNSQMAGMFTKDMLLSIKRLLPQVEARRRHNFFSDPFLAMEPINLDWMSSERFFTDKIIGSCGVSSKLFGPMSAGFLNSVF